MPTIMTHTVVAVCAGYTLGRTTLPKRFWVLGIIAAVLPDADVIGLKYLHIPYGHFLGHRGFFHSPCFAALFSVVAVSLFFRQEPILSRRWVAYVLFFFAVGASHGLLDAMTDGGAGCRPIGAVYRRTLLFTVDSHRSLSYWDSKICQPARPERYEK